MSISMFFACRDQTEMACGTKKGCRLAFSSCPWWNTDWFRAICAVLLLGLMWAIYQLRAQQVEEKFNLARWEDSGEDLEGSLRTGAGGNHGSSTGSSTPSL